MPDDLTQGAQPGQDPNASGTGDTPPLTLDKWREALPEELQTDPNLVHIKDVQSMAKSYVHAQKLIGRDKIPLPTPGNEQEFLTTMDALGRPETPEGYKWDRPADLPPEATVTAEETEWLRKTAHKHGMLPGQFQGLLTEWAKYRHEAMTADAANTANARATADAALREEWGAAFEQKMQMGEKAFNRFASDPMRKAVLEAGGYAKMAPEFARMFAAVGAAIGEDSLRGSQDGSGQFIMTPNEAKARVNKILADVKHPYWDNKSKAHDDAVAEVKRLNDLAYPNQEEA